MIADGSALWAVKKLLLRGEFDGWRRAVFGPRERTAENCMAVGKWLESKSATLRICQIGPTACYLLVRRSVSEGARQEAIRRALAGDKITLAVAHEIIATNQEDGRTNGKRPAAEKRRVRLIGLLNRHMEHWYPTELPLFAGQLRDYADSLAMGKKNKAAAKAV